MGTTHYDLIIEDLNSGIYFIVFESESRRFSQKIIVL